MDESAQASPARKQGRSPARRALLYLAIVLPFLGAIPLYWYFAYLPAGTVSALRSMGALKVTDTPPHPGFIRSYFEFVVPHVVDALYDEDENLALAAFTVVRTDTRALRWLRENRFDPSEEGEATFRATLALEWGPQKKNAVEEEWPSDFRSRYLRWKASNRTGAFALPIEHRMKSLNELASTEGGGAVPFFQSLMKDPATSSQLAIPLAIHLAMHGESKAVLKEAHDFLIRGGINTDIFLHFLQNRSPQLVFDIMAAELQSRRAKSMTIALDYFITHFDREAADLVEPLLVPDEVGDDTLKRVVSSLTDLDEPWTAEWLFRVVQKWYAHQMRGVLIHMNGWIQPHWKAYGRFLELAANDVSGEIRALALDQRIQYDFWCGMQSNMPYGTPQPGRWATALDTLCAPDANACRPGSSASLARVHDALRALRALELQGLDDGGAGARAALLFIRLTRKPRSFGNDEEDARKGLVRFAGWVLVQHGTDLHAKALREGLLTVVCDMEEYASVRIEAAIWLGLDGADFPIVWEKLEEGAREGATRRGFGCSAALVKLGRPRYEKTFRDAWKDNNPVACYLASCEVTRLTPALMAEAVGAILPWALSENTRKKKTGRLVLSSVLGEPPEHAAQAAQAFLQEFALDELMSWWALKAGVPADPDGDISVLRDLVAVMEAPGPAPGPGSCAAWLLRTWTGKRMGFDPTLHFRGHLLAVAKRWKKWIEVNGTGLRWDPGEKRFR